MKKALLVLVLAFAAPLYASTITFTETSPGVIEWTSDVACVAMGLDVNMTTGTVTDVAVDSFFDIYMDVAFDEEDTGDGYTYGEDNGNGPVADQDAAGSIDLATNGAEFCISMGGLGGEVEPLADPCMSGTITLTGAGEGTLGENGLRGGCIDENGDTMTTNLPIDIFGGVVLDCMQQADVHIDDPVRYAAFVEAGKPECWCAPRQCHASAGILEGSSKGGYFYVGATDLNVLMAGWQILEDPFGTGIAGVLTPVSLIPAACANFNNDMVVDPLVTENPLQPGGKGGSAKGGYYHVGSADLNLLMAYWQVLEPAFGPGVPADCFPGNVAD